MLRAEVDLVAKVLGALPAKWVVFRSLLQQLADLLLRRPLEHASPDEACRRALDLGAGIGLESLALVKAITSLGPAEHLEELGLCQRHHRRIDSRIVEGVHPDQHLSRTAHPEIHLIDHHFVLLLGDLLRPKEVVLESLGAGLGAHRHRRAVPKLDAPALLSVLDDQRTSRSIQVEVLKKLRGGQI